MVLYLKIYLQNIIMRKSVSDPLTKKILHDIRNLNNLDENMLRQINKMSHEDKMEIIKTLNDVAQYLKEFIQA